MKSPVAILLAVWLATMPLVSWASPGVAAAAASAIVTEAHGQVFKRGFVDWEKEIWGQPQAAAVGDTLHEGMQVGTGDNSWAQIKWPDVTTRAWANSVFAVAPTRKLVYLLGGEVLFSLKKHRKDKDDYYIWTKVLQVRVRGTTVLVQSAPESSKVSVLEGTISVMNRLDHSVVKLTPGVVYEIKTPVESKTSVPDVQPPPGAGGDNVPPPADQPQKTSVPDSLTNITLDSQPVTPVFETRESQSNLRLANVQNLIRHPLVKDFSEPLESLPLINSALGRVMALLETSAGRAADLISNSSSIQETVPAAALLTNSLNAESAAAVKVLGKNAEIVSVPIGTHYQIGPSIGTALPLPAGAAFAPPPMGYIGRDLPAGLKNTGVVPAGLMNQAAGFNPQQVPQNVMDGRGFNGPAAGRAGPDLNMAGAGRPVMPMMANPMTTPMAPVNFAGSAAMAPNIVPMLNSIVPVNNIVPQAGFVPNAAGFAMDAGRDFAGKVPLPDLPTNNLPLPNLPGALFGK